MFLPSTLNAQGSISGKILDVKSMKPMANVIISLANTNLTQLTNNLGTFSFDSVASGKGLIQIKSIGYQDKLITVVVYDSKITDLGIIILEIDISSEQQLSLVTITENDLGDDNSGSENTAGILQATRDAFQQSSAFNWGQARFRIRGLDAEYATTLINGIPMNKMYDGRPQWSNWGGLNDATRNQEFTTGAAPSDYAFGNILGTQHISTRASGYRKGSRVSFSGTNSNYNFRMMATHASGISKRGWAFVLSASRRWATEGYFDGTDYSANSIFGSVEKRISSQHSLNITGIYSQNRRGKNSPNTTEVNAIEGENYNSYWGWQNGMKRNSRYKNLTEPIIILNHYWKINSKNTLQTNIAYQFGSVGNSRIDFQDAGSPDPTYYKNLPSYFLSFYEKDASKVPDSEYDSGGLGGRFNPDLVGAMSADFLSKQQIDWNAMYRANQSTLNGNSLYVLYEDRTDDNFLIATSIFSSPLSQNIFFNAGITYKKLKSHNFQNLLDLLGGKYYNDIDTFGKGDQMQSDLSRPDRMIKTEEVFGYNYNLFATNTSLFTQFKFSFRKIDFYLAQNFSRSQYQREGLYRNGYYPTISFGKSKQMIFENFGFKGGGTYKINGQQFLNVNGILLSVAPSLRNVFPNSRMSNNLIDNIASETIFGVDGSYILRKPAFKVRFTGYFAKVQKTTETSFFYAEGIFQDIDGNGGSQSSAFVAETVMNLDKKYIGAEIGIEYQMTSTFKITGSAGFGQFTYSNNPVVLLSQDAAATSENLNPTTNFGHASIKNYRLPGTPQQAYGIGLEYRDPKYWWVGFNVNMLTHNYIDVTPLLRTNNFAVNTADINNFPYPEYERSRAKKLLKQQKLSSPTITNLTAGKSWLISGINIGCFASINNLFGIRYKTGGFEQARNASYRELNQDISSNNPAFAPKYIYGYGRTFFTNFYINF